MSLVPTADFTSAVEGSAKQRWQVWVQLAEAASMGHMGTYAHNALAFFSTDKDRHEYRWTNVEHSAKGLPCIVCASPAGYSHVDRV